MDRQTFLAAAASPTLFPPMRLDIPAFSDQPVFIKTLSVLQVQQQSEESTAAAVAVDGESAADFATRQQRQAMRNICRILCDEQGEPLLDPDNADHVATVQGLPWPVMQAIIQANTRHNAVGDDTNAAAGKG